ncbi:MAG: HlyC/CorC family transporter, partial [Clostridia bacterium]|nr:HlyC/CorC family transporter [Clostridia bacterium]
MDSIPLWVAFITCVILGAYFAATESSFSAVNKIKVKTLADDGNRRARGVMYILNRFDRALTTLLVGNNVTKIAGASVFTVIATRIVTQRMGSANAEEIINSFAFSIVCSAASTVIIFLFSEMIPKSFANDRSQSVSMFFQGSLRLLMRVLYPFSAFFGLISKGASKLFARKEVEPSITAEELAEIIDTAEEEGVVDEEQGDILKSALEFDETVISDVMTMAKDVEMLNVDATTEEILAFVRNTVYSRVPVYQGSTDKVIGTLCVRRFLTEYHRNRNVKIRNLLSKPYFVDAHAKIDDVLTDMRQHKHHIAIVVDEEKHVVGLATIEDFLEELVGEIFDE